MHKANVVEKEEELKDLNSKKVITILKNTYR